MHICYIDESGTPETPGTTSHYILAGLSIPVERWKDCDAEIHSIKSKYQLNGKEIHTAWLLRSYMEQYKIPDFEKLNHEERTFQANSYRTRELYRLQKENSRQYRKTKKNFAKTKDYVHLTRGERTSLVIEIAQMVGNWDMARLFAECIDKAYFNPAITQKSTDEQAFEQVVSRFEQYLQITSTLSCVNMGLLIHDNNQTLAHKLTRLMKTFHRKGTLWTQVTNIIETPLFVDSQLTGLVQIADLCSYALRRYLENQESELFTHIFRRADRKDGKVVGIRHFTDHRCRCDICKARQ